VTWDAFFAAEVGAAAALAGLIFVGISINLQRIISLPTVANRALQSLLLLVGVLAIESLLLVPDQTSADQGIMVLAVAVPLWVGLNWIEARSWKLVEKRWRGQFLVHTLELQIPSGLFSVGGVLLVGTSSYSLYWLAPATIVAFFVAIIESWVILVEINR
jgi:hypothetical protein